MIPPSDKQTTDSIRRNHELQTSGIALPLKPILLIVALVSITMQAILFFASDLIVTPDSASYISLAHGIVEHFDFRQENFQFRTPVYPMFLAFVFKIFGKASIVVLPILQHAMIVASAILTSMVAYEIRPLRSFALMAGLIAAFGFHLGSYANAVLTETPYVLFVMLCTYYNVRYMVRGDGRSITLASATAGLATMIRPVGQGLIVVCVMAALIRKLSKISLPPQKRPALNMAMAVIPAALIIVPWMAFKASPNGRFELSYAGNMAFYQRAVFFDGVDPSSFSAFSPISLAIDKAKRDGYINKEVSRPYYYVALNAYQYYYNSTRLEAANAIGEVGRQIMLASPIQAITNTPRHAYRTFFMPDGMYRFLPKGKPSADGKLASDGILYSSDSYTDLVTTRIGDEVMQSYFPQKSITKNFIHRYWASLCRWYHTRIELGSPIFGLLDTPYEEWMALSIVGGIMGLWSRHRRMYLALGYILAYHTIITSFYGGPLPRYIVPISGVLAILTALPISVAYEFCAVRTLKKACSSKGQLIALAT